MNKGNNRPVQHQAWHQSDENVKASPTGSNRTNEQGSPVKPRGRTDVATDEWSNPDEEQQKDKTISRIKYDISKESIQQARRRHEEVERKLKEEQAKAAQAKLKELERKCHSNNNDGTTKLPDTGHSTDAVTENPPCRNVYSEYSTQKHEVNYDSKQQGFRRPEGKFHHPSANPRKEETAPFQLLRRNTSESSEYKDSVPDREESQSFSEVKSAASVDSVGNDDSSLASNEVITIAKKPPVTDAGSLDSGHSMGKVKVDENIENLDDIRRDTGKNTTNAGTSKNVSVAQHQKKSEKHFGYYHDDYDYQYYGGESYNSNMGRSNQKYRGRGSSKRGYPPRQPYDNRPYSNSRRYGKDYNYDQSGKRQPGPPRRTNERNQRNFKANEKYEKRYDNTGTELAKGETKSTKPVQSNARTSSSFSSRGSSNDDRMLELPMVDSDSNQLESASSDEKQRNIANIPDSDQSANKEKDDVIIAKSNDGMPSKKSTVITEDDSSLGIEKITLSDDADRSVMGAITDERRNNTIEKSVVAGNKEPFTKQESLEDDHEMMVKDLDTSDRDSLDNSDKVGITVPIANEPLHKDINTGKSLKADNVVPTSGRKDHKQDSYSTVENTQGKGSRFSKTKNFTDAKGRSNKRNYNRDYDYDNRSYRNDRYKLSNEKGVPYQGSQRQHEQTKISHREDLSVTVSNDKEAQRIVVSERQHGKSFESSAKSDNAKRRNERYPQASNRRNYDEDDQYWQTDWQRHNRNIHSNRYGEGKRYDPHFRVNKNLPGGKPQAAKFDKSGGKGQNRNYSDYGGRSESTTSYNRSNKRVEEFKSSKRDQSHYGDTPANYEGRREDSEIKNYTKSGDNRTNELKVKGETGGYSRSDIDQTFSDNKGKGKPVIKDPVDTSSKGLAEVNNKRKSFDRQRNDNEQSSHKLSHDNVYTGSATSAGQQRELLEKTYNQKNQENVSAKAVDKNLVGKGNVMEYKEQANDSGNNDQVERAWDKPLQKSSFGASTSTRQTKPTSTNSQFDEKVNQKKATDTTETPWQNSYSSKDVSQAKNPNSRPKLDKSTTDEKSNRKSVFMVNEADSYNVDKFRNNLESDRNKVTEKNESLRQNNQMSKDMEDKSQSARYKSERLQHKNDERTDKKKGSERGDYMNYYAPSGKDPDNKGHKFKKTNAKREIELYQPKPRRERDHASRNDFKNSNFKNKSDKNMQVDTKRSVKGEDSQYQEQRKNVCIAYINCLTTFLIDGV